MIYILRNYKSVVRVVLGVHLWIDGAPPKFGDSEENKKETDKLLFSTKN